MGLRDLVYEVYERRLAGRLEQIDRSRLPRHVGIILDGNRRWAKGVGKSTAGGHQAGADKIATWRSVAAGGSIRWVRWTSCPTRRLPRSRRPRRPRATCQA